ncbi:65 kDa regulatory subunit A alpha isoform [Seminavis robusta]|uniref:65 kDa regulatory subunit A alpha isoform n=1 Tax=Seminavis robusta TaxID=568900 RepID=A0A9N8HEM0_9STRA|nr:65 kDa regulatory subunit A alpha isoform [Seminavis robusta]|eukprot:Sro413_g138110.1 65 kDa regulatory subunit A alpha isoform (666) ;mRNA; f:38514-41014
MMEIDPVDDGPIQKDVPTPTGPSASPFNSPAPQQPVAPISKEDEARQVIEMLRAEDVSERVSAARRLEAAAAVLGEQRTRSELLPFLTDAADDEDEVLLAVASSLGLLIPHVGGSLHAHCLLLPLEILLTVEEAAVREAACKSTEIVAQSLPQATFQGEYAEMVSRLSSKEWFTARCSAAVLLSTAYPSFNTQQQNQLLTNFSKLCRDDTPMVRRVAAQNLGKMVKNVVTVMGRTSLTPTGKVTTLLLPLYEELASNDQPDSVRLHTTDNCVIFGQIMSDIVKDAPLEHDELALISRVMPLIMATIDDRSWRVRWTAAAKFNDVISAYDMLPGTMESLVPAFEKLLQDPEAEVRTAATFNLAHVANCKARVLVSNNGRPPDGGMDSSGHRTSVAERLVKRVTSLTEDDSDHVRAALAMVATELAPILGKESTITHLVPPVLLLLRDAASEVRLNLISSLSALNEVIGVDLLSQSLLPAILDLAQDGKWRIRLAIIRQIPLLAKQLGKDFFTEKLISLCVGWLGDDIASIRLAAATNVKELAALFGTGWAMENLIPAVLEIRENKSYLRRLTALQACSMISLVVDDDTTRSELLPIILEMAADGVPNIRFNVAKELQLLAPKCGLSVFESQIAPVLSLLSEDADRDVRFFADKTSQALKKEFAMSE